MEQCGDGVHHKHLPDMADDRRVDGEQWQVGDDRHETGEHHRQKRRLEIQELNLVGLAAN